MSDDVLARADAWLGWNPKNPLEQREPLAVQLVRDLAAALREAYAMLLDSNKSTERVNEACNRAEAEVERLGGLRDHWERQFDAEYARAERAEAALEQAKADAAHNHGEFMRVRNERDDHHAELLKLRPALAQARGRIEELEAQLAAR